jgi:predicted Rossmann fold flavoprotein
VIDIAVIGGGAAGLMAAISAGSGGANVHIFEGGKRCGVKILMSGGTRCNITNRKINPDNFFGSNRNFIKNVLHAFDENAALSFFNSLGVKTKLEPGGKYFPVDDKAASVLDALLGKAEEAGVNINYNSKIIGIEKEGEIFILSTRLNKIKAKKIIIAAGGKSYPSSGSDGTGYKLASTLGHSVIEPFPALTPILLNEPELQALSGITIPAGLTFYLNSKKVVELTGSLLFSHFGITGPAALNISRFIEENKNKSYELRLNFLPGTTDEKLKEKISLQRNKDGGRLVLSFLKELLPENVCRSILKISGMDMDAKFHSMKKEETSRLIKNCVSKTLNVTGTKGFAKAEVTAGGIPLSEVKYQTMESKVCSGLYLCGEILDVDGMIGGFNFQWAWSTGYIAGKEASRPLSWPM